ncbi:Zn-dependent alcohol dehydrogenase [Pseudarthrobacter sp. PS3-L1]|uniref:Zn-dependent alcohol dehydrogenase n=1 Tax=Pseudarthrobacter sp. PS3-L1 TaxID=3046207 RepID=UPI0024B9988E|nr:Zn-dependent alcohol dehydrogenase [Pseudarthrobacter sp. PS3-L1]MDJ0319519.1 Zn-dependent alcohol dehydrogenase [Pseudarthrobacter sp. PS3-L1]
MPTIANAAVHTGAGESGLELTKVTVKDPGPGQVLVRMGASGVCGSDRHVLDGDWSMPSPTVMGHEGAGTVEAVGEGVTTLSPGDHVIMTWFYPCQQCSNCQQGKPWVCTGSRADECVLPDGTSAMTLGDAPAYPYLAVGSMSEYTVVPEQAAIKIPADVPFDVAALIGCSVATGVGVVINDAEVKPGRSAVVIGAGGVGLCIIMGLALAGANPIIAVDVNQESLELARKFGATHTIIAGEDLGAQVREVTETGADYVFEAIGRPQSIAQMPACLTSGGTAVIVGLPPEDSPFQLDALAFAESGKKLLGSNYGSTIPARDFPLLAGLYLNGKLPLDELITHRFGLDRVNEAFTLMREGARGRSVIVF